jgi:hypothetical protein
MIAGAACLATSENAAIFVEKEKGWSCGKFNLGSRVHINLYCWKTQFKILKNLKEFFCMYIRTFDVCTLVFKKENIFCLV